MDVYGSPDGDSRYLIMENIEFGDQDGDLSGGSAGRFSVTNRNSQVLNSHHNKQTGLWSKDAADVILSQNTGYEHHTGNSSLGGGIGWQPGGGSAATGPVRLWVIFNRSCSNDYGVQPGSGTEASVVVPVNVLFGNLNDNHPLFVGVVVYIIARMCESYRKLSVFIIGRDTGA